MSQRTRREFIKQVGAGAVAAAAVAPGVASAASARASARRRPSRRAGACSARTIASTSGSSDAAAACARTSIASCSGRRTRPTSGGGGQRHLDQAQGSGARAGRRRREVGLSRLPRADRASRHRRRRHLLARSLALRSHHGGPEGRQARLPREADDLHGQRGEGDRRRGEAQRQGAAGRQPVHLARSLLEGEEGDRRRPDRRGRVGLGRLRPQQHGARQRVELQDRSRRQRVEPRLEGVPRLRAEARVRSGALLPVAQVLGLLGRHRDRPLLPHRLAAADGHRPRLPDPRLGVGRHLRAEGSRGAGHVLHERRLSGAGRCSWRAR